MHPAPVVSRIGGGGVPVSPALTCGGGLKRVHPSTRSARADFGEDDYKVTPTWQTDDGRVQLYLADCRDVLPHVKADAVVTDPPYGMNATTANMNRGNGNCRWALPTAKSAWPIGGNKWDDEAPAIVLDLPSMATGGCIVWGGQFFPLPQSRGWLVWNKIIRNFQSSVCELAWTNIDAPVDAFDYSHGQLASEGKKHPTQKPLPLMSWCVKKTRGITILDPFMGSGTTGVAAVQLGRKFIGVEVNEAYFDIAVRRISEAIEQHALYEPVPKYVQEPLFP